MRLVTSENLWCARALALECGLITKKESLEDWVCSEGSNLHGYVAGLRKTYDEFEECDKETVVKKVAFEQVCRSLRILARCSPEVKYLLVTGLKDKNLVAVTGNGTNDYKAVKKADVGIAMGNRQGCEITKDASSIVLLDEKFNSILEAVVSGRTIYSNVRKFLQLQLTINLVTMVILFCGAVTYGETPLTPVQLLWLNIIMDTLGAIALATERPNDSVLKNVKPLSRNETVLTPILARNIMLQAAYQILVLLLLFYKGKAWLGYQYTSSTEFYDPFTGEPTDKLFHYTLVFHSMVLMTFSQLLNSRKINEGEFNILADITLNWVFIIITGSAFLIQIALVQFGEHFARTAPLSIVHHLLALILAASVIGIGCIVKLVPAKHFRRFKLKEEEIEEDPFAKEKENMKSREVSKEMRG